MDIYSLSFLLFSNTCRRSWTSTEGEVVPLAGIEPALLAESDFESDASTSSAIGARALRVAAEGTAGQWALFKHCPDRDWSISGRIAMVRGCGEPC